MIIFIRYLIDFPGKAVILCLSSKKEYYKKFLYEPLPVEVSLYFLLQDFSSDLFWFSCFNFWKSWEVTEADTSLSK